MTAADRTAAFMRWLGTPFRAARAAFPFTRAGRSTLVYIAFALSGPSLTLLVLWIMNEAKVRSPWAFNTLAWMVGGALLISVSGLAMYVSLRAIKLGRDGFEASGEGGDELEPKGP